MQTNKVNTYTNDTIIITRTRGWRSELAKAIKSFPPASLESPHRVAIIEVRITLKVITVVKKWNII